MFTGIVTDLGRVRSIERRGDTRFTLATSYEVEAIDLGASIACNGCCLTVTETGRDPDGTGWFAVDASGETLSKTTLGAWEEGTRVNLERALRLGDELGGHFVLGHVDGEAEVLERRGEGDSWRFAFRAPVDLRRFIAPKGSIVLDGVSLTVNEVEEDRFGVNIIPHTFEATGFHALQPGSRVNLEVDALARYVARLLDREQDGASHGG
ncbi:MAG: riboflavin synthase [Nitratireductor sp.]